MPDSCLLSTVSLLNTNSITQFCFMMKRFTILLFALVSFFTAQGAYGIFQAGVTIDGFTYYEDSPTSGANTLNGQNFAVAQGGTLNLTFAYVKTYKNGVSDVCGARMIYAVYPAAGSPSFITKTLCFDFNINGSDQQWSSNACAFSVNLASGLTPGNYKIAVYYAAPGGNCGAPADVFLSNSGANYVANLTIGVPLPVSLIAFEAGRMETGIKLTWQTAAERDHASYGVERRSATDTWLSLGMVKAQGTATESATYSFYDVKPLSGDNYYRLAMQDLVGKTTYSSIVRVAGKSSSWQVGPNPATDELVLNFVEKDAPETTLIQLYNAQGALALEYRAGGSSIHLPLTNLPIGTYWLEIQAGDGVRTALQTIIKQ